MKKLRKPLIRRLTIGAKVRFKIPMMTAIVKDEKTGKVSFSNAGRVVAINDAYIAVRPSQWPSGTFLWCYPCELQER